MSFKEQMKDIEKKRTISKVVRRVDRWWGKTKEIVGLVMGILRVVIR